MSLSLFVLFQSTTVQPSCDPDPDPQDETEPACPENPRGCDSACDAGAMACMDGGVYVCVENGCENYWSLDRDCTDSECVVSDEGEALCAP
jgi:hypothetical protein